jgi:hypothetical protein
MITAHEDMLNLAHDYFDGLGSGLKEADHTGDTQTVRELLQVNV